MKAKAFLAIGVLVSVVVFAVADPSCEGHEQGYYCLSGDSNRFAWCYGLDGPAFGECASALVCKCGFTTDNPCVWATSPTTPDSCRGSPGDFLNDTKPAETSSSSNNEEEESNGEEPADDGELIPGVFTVSPTGHLPLVIKLNESVWKQQLHELIASDFYDDPAAYSPMDSADYGCSFHPASNNDRNPSQFFVGRPLATTKISYTPGVTLRLPDRYFGLMLAYAMDHYGLSPSMLMGLAAKETFATVIFAENDNSLFIVDNQNAHYDCYDPARQGLCRDNNLDGPFQVETGGMSSDVAVFPQRFYLGSESIPKQSRKINTSLTDNEIMNLPGFRAFHDSYTAALDMGRAIVLTALDFHFRHNLLLGFRKIGLYDALKQRTTRNSADGLEFATAMYSYNRGVFDTQLPSMLKQCPPTKDPVTCGLDGYGGHTANIRDACRLLDSVPESELYDFEVTKDDVEYFIKTLEGTYPFESIDHVFEPINWETIRSNAQEAFEILAARRSSATISFRYDWRALVAVVRMSLPQREFLLGPSLKNYANYWGNERSPELGPVVQPSSFPLGFCSVAGGVKDLCKQSATEDLCPNDTAKSDPGQCGCNVPDTDSDGDGTADCIDKCPEDSNKIEPGNCGCGVIESLTCNSACSEQCSSAFLACKETPCNCLQVWTSCMEQCSAGFEQAAQACNAC